MAVQKFKTEWLEQISLLAKCGTADDVVSLCDAITRALAGNYDGELSPIVQLVFNPIAKSLKDSDAVSKRNSANAQRPLSDRSATAQRPPCEEKEEEKEEEGEAERETAKEDIPHTPLEEKDKEKGEEGEEEKEEEREISRPAADEACALALPAPQFVAETDPKKMTDKALEEEFEAIWLFYPRKAGKSDALRHYKAARRKGVDYDTIENGVMRYADYAQGQDPQYIAMGSTWFNGHRWEDQYVRKKSELERLWEL